MRRAILILCFIAGAAVSGTVSDGNIGYTITLPANWSASKPKTLQNYFRDTTRQYHSQISILRYSIDKASYPTPESWTQAQFIAYKLSIESSTFPFGTMVFYDSTATIKLSTHWAPEAFSVLYPADGDPTYCEYLRYCANGDYGYEIYAIGDSTDMWKNVDFYAGIISSLQLFAPVSISARSTGARKPAEELEIEAFDLIGRRVQGGRLGLRVAPSGILLRNSPY